MIVSIISQLFSLYVFFFVRRFYLQKTEVFVVFVFLCWYIFQHRSQHMGMAYFQISIWIAGHGHVGDIASYSLL